MINTNKIRILHLSDLHWHQQATHDLRIVRDALLDDLKLLTKENGPIDLCLFTGDLVRGGEISEDFHSAYTEILKPILDELQLPIDRFVMCPGNHDISRKTARLQHLLEPGLREQMASVTKINSFIDDLSSPDSINHIALDRSKNYKEFLKTLDFSPTAESDLYQVRHFIIGGNAVSIASIDNSWRASGESGSIDRGRLVMGERTIDRCADLMGDAALRIAMFHHPIDWLVECDSSCVSPRLFNEFDLIAFGHVHATQPELRVSPSGTSIVSQSGALYAGREYFNGYQIIDIDIPTCEATISMRTFFNSPARRFGPAENIVANGKITLQYSPRAPSSKPELEKLLREVRETIRAQALEQFNVSDLGAAIGSDPHTAFICPPIFMKRGASTEEETDEASEIDTAASTREVEVELVDLLRSANNLLFVGSREGGKSSLAHFMAVQVSDGNSDRTRIPIIVDYRSFSPSVYGLKKAAAAYLRVTKAGLDLEKSLSAGDLLVFLDNFSGADVRKREQLEEMLDRYPNCRWIALADAWPGSTNPEIIGNDLLRSAEVARLDRLPRRSIRELTRRWCARTGADSEAMYTAVMRQIKEGDLPRNGYIVTLLLWAIAQNKKIDAVNESVLIMNMADFLLGKADFTKSLKGEFDATSKEITLQRIAGFLRTSGGISTQNALALNLLEFFETMGLKYDVSDVIGNLCECGILKRSDGDVSFKYRCFEEYFEACRIGSSEKSIKAAIYNREYLSNVRQLDLLSGIHRQNSVLIEELLLELELCAPEELRQINKEEFENIVQEASNVGLTEKKLQKIRKKRLTTDQVDDLVDAAEAKLTNRKKTKSNGANHTGSRKGSEGKSKLIARPVNAPLRPGEYMITLDLLGRVLTNSEFTPKPLKIRGGVALLDGSARVLLKLNGLIQEAVSEFINVVSKTDSEFDEQSMKGVRYFMTRKTMGLVSDRLSDVFSSSKLSGIYDEILKEPSIQLSDRTLLIATLLDAGYEEWSDRWIEAARSKPTKRLVIEFLADKLWSFMHRKAMNERLRMQVEKTAVELQLALTGLDKIKSTIIRDVRRSTDKAIKDSEASE